MSGRYPFGNCSPVMHSCLSGERGEPLSRFIVLSYGKETVSTYGHRKSEICQGHSS